MYEGVPYGLTLLYKRHACVFMRLFHKLNVFTWCNSSFRWLRVLLHPFEAFLIVSLAVEVKETQILMVGPTVCCVLWGIVNSIWSVPRLFNLLWMLPYKMLATFLTIVRQEEVRLHAGACYCIFSFEYFHQNACAFVLVLGYFFQKSCSCGHLCVST